LFSWARSGFVAKSQTSARKSMRSCVTVSQKLWALRFWRLSCLLCCDLSASQFHSLFFAIYMGAGVRLQVSGFRFQVSGFRTPGV
jgi:hypothetical protein